MKPEYKSLWITGHFCLSMNMTVRKIALHYSLICLGHMSCFDTPQLFWMLVSRPQTAQIVVILEHVWLQQKSYILGWFKIFLQVRNPNHQKFWSIILCIVHLWTSEDRFQTTLVLIIITSITSNPFLYHFWSTSWL